MSSFSVSTERGAVTVSLLIVASGSFPSFLLDHLIDVSLVHSLSPQPIQLASQQAVQALLENAPSEIPQLQAAYDAHFPSEPLSATRSKLAQAGVSKNIALEDALVTTLDAVDFVVTTLNTVERFM